jgi:uncharacterized protein (DUF488 family)
MTVRNGHADAPVCPACDLARRRAVNAVHNPPTRMTTIFTVGYQKRSLDEFIELLLGASIDVLIDVRETAWSHKPGFSKGAFSKALAAAGIDYLHARFAGNPKRLRAGAATHAECLTAYARYVDSNVQIIEDFEQLVRQLLEQGKTICLTCFERHHEDCHRSILTDRWQRRAHGRVRHLAIDGCDRLVASG